MDCVKLSPLHRAYISDLIANGGSPRTAEDYARDFRDLLAFIRADDVRVLVVPKLMGFAAWLAERGVAIPTAYRKIASASSFCKWMVRRGDIDRNPFDRVPRPKRPKRLPRPLSHEAVERLLEFPGGSIIDRAMIAVLRHTGIRVSELTALDLEDLDPQGWLLRIWRKGGKAQVIPILEGAYAPLLAWLGARGMAPGPFFYGRRGRFTRMGVEARLARLAAKAGLSDVTPHRLRHTFGTETVRAGVGIRQVQEWMGHQSISTTEQYVEVTAADLARAKAIVEAFERARRVGA